MMRPILLLTLFWMLAPAVQAECVGQNLIAALPATDRTALQAAADAVPYPKGNLWQGTKGGQTITLIGTYHLDDPRHDATMTAVAPAFATATALLVEAGPAEEAALKADVAAHPERLIAPSGPTLPEALPDAVWQRLSDALRARGIPPFTAARLRPWYLTSLLAIPACQFNAAAAQNGLDRRLMDLATAQGLPIAGLEPFDTVFTIFDSFPVQDQLAMLTQSLDAGASDADMAVTLGDSYFAGENRLFWEFSKAQLVTLSGLTVAEAERETALIETAMVTRRNTLWIGVIQAAAAKGPVIVAVGALHLPGDMGVLNLLAGNGWTVRALTP